MDFKNKLAASWKKSGSLLCVGLDPDLTKMPQNITDGPDPLFTFNKAIIDATADLVCVYKPNSAFYEALRAGGIEQLKKTCDYLRDQHPTIPIILDYKRGDIGNTNNFYAMFAFDYLGVDAITISPYMGREANEGYLTRSDKGIVVLCRTSNPGAGEFQDLIVDGEPLYLRVARAVMTEWNQNNNCLLVIGATNPGELANVRKVLGDEAIFLIPGVGAQGASVKDMLQAGLNDSAGGVIINSSREILFASNGNDFADAARKKAVMLKDEINKYR